MRADQLRDLIALNMTDEQLGAVIRILMSPDPRPKKTALSYGWARTRAEFLDGQDLVCAYCGDQDGPFHVDHVLPRAKGGTDDPSNLVIACQFCNCSKRDKTIDEWKGQSQ